MRIEYFEQECPACQPRLIDPDTGEQLPLDSPAMRAVLEAWQMTPHDERVMFHQASCLKSNVAADMSAVFRLVQRIQATMMRMQIDQ